jgi:hypothetical protein
MSKQATAAVSGMSIAEMRRLLAETRSLLDGQKEDSPFRIDTPLSNGEPLYSFTMQVAYGIHEKRSKNSTYSKVRKE